MHMKNFQKKMQLKLLNLVIIDYYSAKFMSFLLKYISLITNIRINPYLYIKILLYDLLNIIIVFLISLNTI